MTDSPKDYRVCLLDAKEPAVVDDVDDRRLLLLLCGEVGDVLVGGQASKQSVDLTSAHADIAYVYFTNV